MKFAFAADREIGVEVLRYLIDSGDEPAALMVSEPNRASHASELRDLCPWLPPERFLVGDAFRVPSGLDLLKSLDLDWIVCVHFPYLAPPEVLALPRLGVLNLHPAYLPWNRGWHTPSWAILKDTPIGATLHYMDEHIDTGDIIHQREIEVRPDDTAHTLYRRLWGLELEVFREAWPSVREGTAQRIPQDSEAGSVHRRRDLFSPTVQLIELDEPTTARQTLRQLRALSTSRWDEAAYFSEGGKRYRVRVEVEEASPDAPPQDTPDVRVIAPVRK